ncbi:alkaline phosphatase [Turicibacter sanguinis]|uniref:alkaline phosphatase n=1 Tax=Turicibacter sanguinis TaxID=154288 RepID=UPI00232ECBB4|nr:alkaline phosphatase [Turicibacter sanguinis]MDB8574003.1 alkaline phosphatase [Turicibacter sanguinis]MDB8576809.1 alkaline phosphatase [Turicibacter sanguinis]MDB8582839.1 alkaline phosphatase [Turicibacter sanguinis]MDB8587271.1 alkaline phosphatase [Turicibacter sanguinis]MDB8596551.1 alkaline phosphatase [Turicibacter sanguinis]
MNKKWLNILLSMATALTVVMGCSNEEEKSVSVAETIEVTVAPKYVFMFIGDGMSQVQVNAAQVYTGNDGEGEITTNNLNFTAFPTVGLVTTHNSTSFVPDSASTATALSSGVKTHSGVIGLEANKTKVTESITEKLKLAGKKIGIVTTVTINHATPAAYYAHVPSRGDYYEIATQLATSNFDYFGGGSIAQPTGKNEDERNVYEIIEENGYQVAKTKEDILALDSSSGKVYAQSPVLQDSGAMPYAIDAKEDDLMLADFVEKGIKVLDNEQGFFMMVESGKVDWACHANDAMTAIAEVLAFEDVVQVAIDFANEHPEETLILVTGDHETGGMSIGYAKTGYHTAFELLKAQKMSYVAFDELIKDLKASNPNLTFEDVYPIIKENFGLISSEDEEATHGEKALFVMSDDELKKLKAGFEESMKNKDDRDQTEEAQILYGGYDPLSVSLTHLLNNKAGIGWTSYAHTGAPVAIYARGVGAELFSGFYDNVDVFHKLVEICQVD